MVEPTLNQMVPKPIVVKNNWQLYGYNEEELIGLIGECKSEVQYEGTKIIVEFMVVEGARGNLLNYGTCLRLGVIEEPRKKKRRKEVEIEISDGEEEDCQIIEDFILLE